MKLWTLEDGGRPVPTFECRVPCASFCQMGVAPVQWPEVPRATASAPPMGSATSSPPDAAAVDGGPSAATPWVGTVASTTPECQDVDARTVPVPGGTAVPADSASPAHSLLDAVAYLPSEDGSRVEVWDPRVGHGPVRALGLPLPEGAPPRGLCTAVVPCPRAGAVFVAYEDGNVYVHDVGSGSVCCQFAVSKQPVMCLTYDAASGKGVCGSASRFLRRFQYDHVTMSGGVVESESCKLPHTGVSSVAVRGDGILAASTGWDGVLRLYDWGAFPACLAALRDHDGALHCVRFAEADTRAALGCSGVLATAGKDGRVVLRSMYPAL